MISADEGALEAADELLCGLLDGAVELVCGFFEELLDELAELL